jgi:hypothetical protein
MKDRFPRSVAKFISDVAQFHAARSLNRPDMPASLLPKLREDGCVRDLVIIEQEVGF